MNKKQELKKDVNLKFENNYPEAFGFEVVALSKKSKVHVILGIFGDYKLAELFLWAVSAHGNDGVVIRAIDKDYNEIINYEFKENEPWVSKENHLKNVPIKENVKVKKLATTKLLEVEQECKNMKTKVKTFQSSVNRSGERLEVIDRKKRKSLTKPEKILSVREILLRHTRGMPYRVNTQEPVFSEVFIPQVKRMDFTEIEELKKINQARAEHLQAQIDKAHFEKMKAEALLKDKQELAEFLTEFQKAKKEKSSKEEASK